MLVRYPQGGCWIFMVVVGRRIIMVHFAETFGRSRIRCRNVFDILYMREFQNFGLFRSTVFFVLGFRISVFSDLLSSTCKNSEFRSFLIFCSWINKNSSNNGIVEHCSDRPEIAAAVGFQVTHTHTVRTGYRYSSYRMAGQKRRVVPVGLVHF